MLSTPRPNSRSHSLPTSQMKRPRYHSDISNRDSIQLITPTRPPPSSEETIAVSPTTLREVISGRSSATNMTPIRSVNSQMNMGNSTGLDASAVPVSSKKAGRMLQCIRDLQHLGIENTIPELPSICVVGDQSVGKSSLIEAISGISVPRSAGTCTRCPLEINITRMTKDSDDSEVPQRQWYCKIYLMKRFFYEGARSKASKARPFGPWVKQQMVEEILFTTTENKRDLPDIISRAQTAILNPQEDPRKWLNADYSTLLQQTEGVKFSPNVVRLDVFSDEITELSLFDLPGVISVPETEEERYLVNLVENLVRSYIVSRSSINLLALPMNVDAVNSKAADMIQRFGDRSRTVGVLTKPDLISTDGSIEQWIDILEGRKFSFGHGYFVVCNLADARVSHATARQEERKFFRQEPWTSMPLVAMESRFGTDNLAVELQGLLEKQIRQNLPVIRERIGSRIAQISKELLKLPRKLEVSATLLVLENLFHFKQNLDLLFGMVPTSHTFHKEWKQLARRFRGVLSDTRPKMKRYTRKEEERRAQQASNEQNNDDVMAVDVEAGTQTPTGSRRKRDNLWDACNGIEYYLDDIRETNVDMFPSTIPGNINPKAIELMTQRSIRHWDVACDIFHREFKRLVESQVKLLVTKSFDPHYHGTRLYTTVLDKVKEFLGELLEMQQKRAKEFFDTELKAPYTSDEDAMRKETDSAKRIFEHGRRNIRAQTDDQSPRKIPKLGKPDGNLGPDEWTQEIECLAYVRGYYTIAHSRFADNICQSVQAILFTQCREILPQMLDEFFQLQNKKGEQICEELLADDPETVQARNDFEAEVNRLERALQTIEEVYAAEAAEDQLPLRQGSEVVEDDHFARNRSQTPPPQCRPQ